VAAQGHAHLQVSKSIGNAGSRSAVRMLSDDERVAELARMLDGLEIGSESIELARRMLANAG
ncbi:MAG TPA: DNA repair protein RecN, partial [Xanthomonadales bacterium]|nr:DNA repair protein RecN [Xanthomonadales bacterium]